MGYITEFYFRAKLIFNLPEPIRQVLRFQFQTAEQDQQMHERLLRSEHGATAAACVGWGQLWGAYYNQSWIGHPAHEFFDRTRAMMIPYGGTGLIENVIMPSFVEYPDGSSKLEFQCEFKNYEDEINSFLDWIKPYVRLKYGRRNRGRDKVWVGYKRPETYRGRINHFIKAVASPERDFTIAGLPGYPSLSVQGTMFGRAVEEQWAGQFD